MVETVSVEERMMDVPHTPPEPATVAPAPNRESEFLTVEASEKPQSQFAFMRQGSYDWGRSSLQDPATKSEAALRKGDCG